MSEWVKLGQTEYNKEAICSMSLTEFKKIFSKKLGVNTDNFYYKITGKKKKSKKSASE